jgi:hypothetical protein
MRTHRTYGSPAVPAAVRVSSIVAARITLRDGLADQDTTDLSSPAFCGSARYASLKTRLRYARLRYASLKTRLRYARLRYARLTAKRLYYRTFNHVRCQHTRNTKPLAESRLSETKETRRFFNHPPPFCCAPPYGTSPGCASQGETSRGCANGRCGDWRAGGCADFFRRGLRRWHDSI